MKTNYELPTSCLKCKQQLFVLNGRKVTSGLKFGDDVNSVLLYCQGCKQIVAESFGKTVNWYVEL